jgi:hypothetical protein
MTPRIWRSADNYQVQEKLENGEWGWFSDFETFRRAKEMKEVYQHFYPNKTFRIDCQFFNDQPNGEG